MITDPPDDMMLRHGDWLRVAGPWALPEGWLGVVGRMLDAMAEVARSHGLSVTVGPLTKDVFEIGVRWSAEASPEDARSRLADAVAVTRLRSQAVCETCGRRGFMRRLTQRPGFEVACDEHTDAGSETLADQTIAEHWTDGERFWRRVYDPDTDSVRDEEQAPP
jgi:hypothetical protein